MKLLYRHECDPEASLKRISWVRSLITQGVRCISPAPGDNPLLKGGVWMSAWEVEQHSWDKGAVEAPELGKALRALHCSEYEGALPCWHIPDFLSSRAHLLPAAYWSRLQATIDSLKGEKYPGHGDAWIGNLLPGPQGPVWADFEHAGLMPREWDLAPSLVGHRRFGTPDWAGLLSGYQLEIDQQRIQACVELREAQLIICCLLEPKTRSEGERRLASLEEPAARWRPVRTLASKS